jgi:hypothetical protein
VRCLGQPPKRECEAKRDVIERNDYAGMARKAPAGGDVRRRSKLVHRSMAAELGGAIAFDWSEEGVVVTLRMSKDRLAH